jgi:hypothetical protein
VLSLEVSEIVFVSCYCYKQVGDIGDSSGIQRQGNVRSWKPLRSNGGKGVTVDISVCNSEL